jgi:hypothetical protein
VVILKSSSNLSAQMTLSSMSPRATLLANRGRLLEETMAAPHSMIDRPEMPVQITIEQIKVQKVIICFKGLCQQTRQMVN